MEIAQCKAAQEGVQKARLERRESNAGTLQRRQANNKVRTLERIWRAKVAVKQGKARRKLRCRHTGKMETDQ